MQIDPNRLVFRPELVPEVPGNWVFAAVPDHDFDLYLPEHPSGHDAAALDFFLSLDLEVWIEHAIRFARSIFSPGFTQKPHDINCIFVFHTLAQLRIEFWFEENPYMCFYVLLKDNPNRLPHVLSWGGEYC